MKVLIVDDSLVYRSIISSVLKELTEVQIVGSVRSGPMALEWLESNSADLITLDMEMPEMPGLQVLESIQLLKNQKKIDLSTEVVVLSSHTPKGAAASIKALTSGALEVISKPINDSNQHQFLKQSFEKVIQSIKFKNPYPTSQILKAKSFLNDKNVSSNIDISKPVFFDSKSKYKVIVIGISTGGPKALTTVLPKICNFTNLPILIVQHMPPGFTLPFSESLNRICKSRVKEGEHREVIENNTVYIAPGGKHMSVTMFNGQSQIKILDDEPELNCKPSVNVLFRSVAQVYGSSVISLIMTGMGNDGAQSLVDLHKNKARIIAQDEASCVVYGMPKAAMETNLVQELISLEKIPDRILEILKER